MTILDVYKSGLTMYKTAEKLGISLEEVRRCVMKHNAGRTSRTDRTYLDTYQRAPLTPRGK